MQADSNRLELRPLAVRQAENGNSPFICHASARVDADRRARGVPEDLSRTRPVAAPVANVAPVRARTADHVRCDADGDPLLDGARAVEELNIVAARRGDQQLVAGQTRQPRGVGLSSDFGGSHGQRCGPGVFSVVTPAGDADMFRRPVHRSGLRVPSSPRR